MSDESSAHVRRKGLSREEAEDLTQEYCSRRLEKHFLRRLSPDAGRLRACRLKRLEHLLTDEWDRAKAWLASFRVAWERLFVPLCSLALATGSATAQQNGQNPDAEFVVEERVTFLRVESETTVPELVSRATSLCLANGYRFVELPESMREPLSESAPPGSWPADPLYVRFHEEEGRTGGGTFLDCTDGTNQRRLYLLRNSFKEKGISTAAIGSGDPTATILQEVWRDNARRTASICLGRGYRYLELPLLFQDLSLAEDLEVPEDGRGPVDIEIKISFHEDAGAWRRDCAQLAASGLGSEPILVPLVEGYRSIQAAWAAERQDALAALIRIRLTRHPCLELADDVVAEALVEDPLAFPSFVALQGWIALRIEPPNQAVETSLLWAERTARMKTRTGSEFASDFLAYHAAVSNRTGGVKNQEMAIRLLLASLDNHQENAEAGHLLVYVQELLGEYGEAVKTSRRTLEVSPDDEELQLRWAVNLGRTRPRQAVEPLTALTRDANPDWIRTVAYRELWRLARERGDVDGARDLLVEAIRSLGKREELVLPLSLLATEDSRRPADDDDPIDWVIGQFSEDRGESARLRYALGPVSAVDRLAARMEEHLERSRPSLRQRLEQLDPPNENRAIRKRCGESFLQQLP